MSHQPAEAEHQDRNFKQGVQVLSKQFSSSSSSSSLSTPVSTSISDVQFNSGLAQSVSSISAETKRSPSPPQSLTSPTLSGARRWEICYDELKFGKSLGKGAYGEVFAGTYNKSKVAVKVYDFRGALTQEQQIAVLSEADLMEGLRSEYLVGFRGICFDPRYCLVMEHCGGGTLRARLDDTHPIHLLDQMRWVMQVSYGLHQLHEVRIIHRDLKGENILLDKSSDAKVADFGLSVVKLNSATQNGGHHGNAAGTLPWMAPELFNRESNSPATDVYSLGMVLWEILTRKVPFAGVMPMAILGMVMMGKREELPEKCPEIFRLMIMACWKSDSKGRPTAEVVGDQFDAALKSIESVPMIVSTENKEETQPGRRELEQLRAEVARLKLEREHSLQISPPKSSSSSPGASQSIPLPQDIHMPTELKPVIKSVDEKALNQLLQFVVEGQQEKAEELIMTEEDDSLLLSAGSVTDLSGREFKQITAFQYALWALDWHMWQMLLKYLPKSAAMEQFTALQSKGAGVYGKFFSFKPLIDALQVYVDKKNLSWEIFESKRLHHWVKVVGGAQRLLPAHVVQEYYRKDRSSFDPCPQFTDDFLPRTVLTDSGKWYERFYVKDQVRYGRAWDKGCTFYFYSFDRKLTHSSVPPLEFNGSQYGLLLELSALRTLSKIRTQQLELLPSQLKLLPDLKMTAVDKLLRLVAEGQQDLAEQWIKKNKNLLLSTGRVMDLSGREFKQITAFQYALWALDWHMWKMILKYLPETAAKEQLVELETKGTAHEPHFSFQPLINALQTVVNKVEEKEWTRGSNKHLEDHLYKVVGEAQRLLPAHVINEYCDPNRLFNPCPLFTEELLLRTMKFNLGDVCEDTYGYTGYTWHKYQYNGGKLGVTFVIAKDGSVPRMIGRTDLADYKFSESFYKPDFYNLDLRAIQSLSRTRALQLKWLSSQLLSQNIYPLTLLQSDKRPVDEKTLGKLLELVVEGEQDEAEKMIVKDKHLLLAAGKVMDLSGREFRQITAFQYALWALDWHMWKMILKYLPQEAAVEQLTALESKGTEHGAHFSLQLLIDGLQTLIDKCEIWNQTRFDNYWSLVVGGAQRLLPTHVVNEYCRLDRSFDSAPTFTEDKLPRTRVYGGYKKDWFISKWDDKILGCSYAMVRNCNDSKGQVGQVEPCAGPFLYERQRLACATNLKALQLLSKTRHEQLESLSLQLNLRKSLSPSITTVEDKKSSATLQDALVTACEQGDLSAVKRAIQKGAQPFYPDSTGKQPVGAAVWGMSVDILEYLLSRRTHEKSPTWEEIEKHNREYYQNQIWLIEKCTPENFADWQALIEKMDNNLFIREIHLQLYNQQYQKELNWYTFSAKINQRNPTAVISERGNPFILLLDKTYQDLKSKIKMTVDNFIRLSSTIKSPAKTDLFEEEDDDIFKMGETKKESNSSLPKPVVNDSNKKEVEMLVEATKPDTSSIPDSQNRYRLTAQNTGAKPVETDRDLSLPVLKG